MPNLTFTPTLIVLGTRFELPRPIVALRIQDSWDFSRFKVPLLDGDVTAGRSQSGVDIAIEGQIGTQAGVLKALEADMFATLEQLRSLLLSAVDSDISLVLYRDEISGDEHYFHQCSLTHFEYDLSDKHLFGYSVSVHASDPVLLIGIPG